MGYIGVLHFFENLWLFVLFYVTLHCFALLRDCILDILLNTLDSISREPSGSTTVTLKMYAAFPT